MTEPVTLAEARAQVGIIDDADTTFDGFLTSLIAPARATVERISCYFWVATSRTETFGSWSVDAEYRHHGYFWGHRHSCGQFLEIYRRPIASIDSVTYGPNGNDTAYTGFIAPVGRFPLRIYPAQDSSFPCLNQGDVIAVTYTSGALDAASEEYLLGKRAMLLLIGHWFANREAVLADTRAATVDVPWAVTELLNDLRPVSAY